MSEQKENTESQEDVILETWKLNDTLGKDLHLPDYQRIYCWDFAENVIPLIKDIFDISKEYRLGTLILQKKKDIDGKEYYDIIDGQQRLVTLSLILYHLGKQDIKLLKQSFHIEEAEYYLYTNSTCIKDYIDKYIIDKYITDKKTIRDNLLENISFSVLILQDSSLDLAYTFFSNTNSKGKDLTDYDLLKAHHLYYLGNETQAEHLATLWDKMNSKHREQVLDTYIFRLRKWLNFDSWNELEERKVKKEYEAAAICDDIPPFGEQFNYKEPIQGGEHFFAFVSHFIYNFNNFSETTQYKTLHNTMTTKTHWYIRNVIEAFLFAYYLKFRTNYLSEALCLIMDRISEVRYGKKRIKINGKSFPTVLNFGKETRIAMIIDRATSPTFFLAELENKTKISKEPEGGIKKGFYDITVQIKESLKGTFMSKHFEEKLRINYGNK